MDRQPVYLRRGSVPDDVLNMSHGFLMQLRDHRFIFRWPAEPLDVQKLISMEHPRDVGMAWRPAIIVQSRLGPW